MKKRMKFLCRIFGHKMIFDTDDVAGPSHCNRSGCEHKKPGINWGINWGDNDRNRDDVVMSRSPIVEGTLPEDDLRRAFVMGAKWREFNRTGSTMWQSDIRMAEIEAEKRYPGGSI